MRVGEKNGFKISKIKPFQGKGLQRKQFLAQSVNIMSPSIQDSHTSIDNYFYRDNATLHNYPFSQLKESQFITHQTLPISNLSNFGQQDSYFKKVEQQETWKKIQENGYKILVNGIPIKTISRNSMYEDQTNYETTPKSEEPRLELLKTNTTQNHLNSDSFSILDSNRSISESKFDFNANNEANLDPQSLLRLKYTVNTKLQKANKKLFQNYLRHQNEQQLNFNLLAKKSYQLSQKVKKLQKLEQILDKNHENLTKKSVSQQKHQPFTERNRKQRLKTEIINSNRIHSSRRQASLQKFRTHLQQLNKPQSNQESKTNQFILRHKKKVMTLKRFQQLTKDIEDEFTQSWKQIDNQIKVKFRRQIGYSLTPNKMKQKYLDSSKS